MSTQSTSDIALNPSRIMQVGYGFWASKVLLTAVQLDLFTHLSETGKTMEEIRTDLKLQGRGLHDFLDTLVALKFLERDGLGATGRYHNSVEADTFLNKKRSSYMGGILVMANNRLYGSWGKLGAALQTGLPQNEIQGQGQSAYDTLYSDDKKLEEFVYAMSGSQRNAFAAFAKKFDSTGYKTHCDIGGSSGDLSIQLALQHPQLTSLTLDLPQIAWIPQKNIESHNLSDRIKVGAIDFFTEDFPKADIITMGNILHNWDLEKIHLLIAKAYRALPEGGVLVVIENVIDNDRRENAFGLMMSLNMLVNTNGGFNFTAQNFGEWANAAGFSLIETLPLTPTSSALIAYK